MMVRGDTTTTHVVDVARRLLCDDGVYCPREGGAHLLVNCIERVAL
jgi:hypothetical protein